MVFKKLERKGKGKAYALSVPQVLSNLQFNVKKVEKKKTRRVSGYQSCLQKKKKIVDKMDLAIQIVALQL